MKMFITCLTKDFSCFGLIEKANNDPSILALDNKRSMNLLRKQTIYPLSQCFMFIYTVFANYDITLNYIYTLQISIA